MTDSKQLFERRKRRVRHKIRLRAGGQARLSVFRSNKHIYAQVIDDRQGRTVVSASSLEKGLRGKLKTGGDLTAAVEIGKLVATRAVAAGVTDVVFDRSGYRFHGRVKALADAARENGLSF